MFYLSIAAVVIILAIAYKSELTSFFGKLKPKKKEVSTFRSAVNDSKHNDNRILCYCVTCIISGFVIGVAFGIFAFKPKSKPNDVKAPLQKVVLTISDVGDGYNCKYVKFSDGHTIKADVGSKDYTKWVFFKKGDKVRKLIYANKEPEYTPEFDDNINKDSTAK